MNGEEVKDLVIPNNVTSIRKYAFEYCSDLTSVTIGNSVASIGDNAFSDCSGLKSVTIGNSVTSIGGYAFSDCFGLKSVTIGNSVTSIGGNAFSGCSGLSSVIIGNGVTSIGVSAFQGCNGLTSVSLPNSVTSIGGNAFSACSGLTSVTIGSGVRYIYGKAFSDCPELLDVYCHAEEVPTTSSNTFDGSYTGYATLHVLDALWDSYKATEPWSGFGKIVTLSGEEPEPEDPEVKKCAAPVLVYEDGNLEIKCGTEGAEFITNVVAEDAKKYYEPWIEFNATYNIEVYAMKANYENSDTVNVALVWVENGKVGEESGVISVEAAPVLIQANGGNLTINGVAKGCEIVVYTLNGTEVTRATATEGSTTINTGLQSGTVAIVKLGNKSVKIKI
ncbi:MAG: leucine-rich repeat domain-containing protein [Bacteroidaceae bacterium]|nr:leucine-rich repeat domain-containing protein [Bacteroidaceae bacterium]